MIKKEGINPGRVHLLSSGFWPGVILAALLITTACDRFSPQKEILIPVKVEALEDRDGIFSIDNILSGKQEFSPLRKQNINLGYTDSTWWFRVSADSAGLPDGDYILLYNQTWTKTVDAFIPSASGIMALKAGNEHGFNARPLPDIAYAFPVKIIDGKTVMYLKLKSSYRIVCDFRLMSRESFFKRRSLTEPFYGIIVAFLIYNIILFFFIRGREYLYYAGFLITYILFLLSFDGTGFKYIWGNSPAWDDFALTGMLMLQSFWVILFFIEFADTEKSNPRITFFLRFLAAMILAAIPLKIIFPDQHILLWSMPLLQIIAMTLVIVSLLMALKGSKIAAYFFLSFSTLLVFSLLNSLVAYSILEDFFIIHIGMHIGATVCAITFSLGMAQRINTLRINQAISEKTVKEQNLQLANNYEKLEAMNLEIRAAMEELEATNEEIQAIMVELQNSNMLLWESEQRLSAIFNKAPIGISVTDLDGNIQQINDYALSMLGYSRSEITGKPVSALTHPDDHARGEELFAKLVTGKIGSYRFDKKYLKKDGTIWWADVSATSIKSERGDINAIIGIALDISEKIESQRDRDIIQAQLMQAQKLEAVGTLTGGIAHDFNNILTAIMGYTELAIAESRSGIYNVENLHQVLNASKRARDIIKQILTISRKNDILKYPQRITPIIKDVLKLLRATTPSTIEIEFADTHVNDTVICDLTQIQQVLLNICTNANYAMRDRGGKLSAAIKNITIAKEKASLYKTLPGEYIIITISDTGTGMSRETAERIFDPFFTTKPPGSGTGLGLSVARGIIIDHGGFITAESIEDEGTLFSIYLPVTSEVEEKKPEQKSPIIEGNERLLIVDDEHVIAEMTRLILQRLGYRIRTATGSLEALQIFKASPDEFDLVITDQTMPDMTGTDLAMEIKAARPDIPVILCTGYSESVDAEKASAMGITDFLFKPVLAEDLADAIRKALDGTAKKV